jgi:riboflavin kinase/FMN adenylyltransferase
MRVLYWPDADVPPPRPCACTIGVFDGLHRGHQAIISSLHERATAAGLPAVVVTFDRHPASVTGAPVPPALTSLPLRLELMERNGADACVLVRFTHEIAEMTAETFARTVLAEFLAARDVVIGFNFRFGRGRKGTPELLAALGQRLGFTLDLCPALTVDGEAVSSTLIRRELAAGNVTRANELLGWHYRVHGRAERGDGTGHRIGFPTANLRVTDQLLPARGVYVALTELEGQIFPSVVSVGTRRTFHHEPDAPVVLETHLLNFDGVLYERDLTVIFLRHLREQKDFHGAAALKAAIGEDVRAAATFFLDEGRDVAALAR